MNIRSLLVVFFLFFAPVATAAEKGKIEAGFLLGSQMATSSSPVSGASFSSSTGISACFIGKVDKIKEPVEYTLGFSQQSYDVGLGGQSIGSTPTRSLYGTIRYRNDEIDPRFKPYVGAGLHHTTIGSASFSGLEMGSGSITGILTEIGVRIKLDDRWHVDINGSKRFGQTSMPITTTVGAVPVTTVTASGPTTIRLSVGFSF